MTIEGWDNGEGYLCEHDKDDKHEIKTFKEYFEFHDLEPVYGTHFFFTEVFSENSSFFLFHITSQGLAIGITAMGIILIIFLIITYRRRFFISFWLMKQRRKYKHLEKKEMTDLYDVFISYSQEQHDWVTQQLIPELEEKNPKLRVCIHERDFKVGVTVTENIVDCIYRSGKFLMVLSDGFIKSQWCQFESHVAQHKLRGGDRWDRSKS